ncbi:Coxsackievirus and adenovirus receptor-like [Oryzias melastigma]|uniref:Coxsackievirus and adenovirus receptor-like n=1 Tax=Oryzias melastigma TaxID=30732 RepID=A0A834C875_ORYME|nr:Coxsackievirus and adenovirus receptor-like [Oryzias melastigma]
MLRRSCAHGRMSLGLGWKPSSLLCWLSTAALVSSGMEGAIAMKVTSTGSQTMHKAAGDSVILNCSYTPGPLDTGELDIEWSVVSPDSTQKDQMLLSYASSTQYQHDDRSTVGGLSFASGDPSNGDASLLIEQLSPAHTATYQCKVKKSPGVDMQKTSLVVMVKPSVPKCWLRGEELIGEDVSLHCQSAKGSTPLKYTWRRESVGPIPAAAMQNSVTGELRFSNLSQSFAGIYLCEVNNAVGAQRCRINLKASKPPNRAGVIVGTLVGSLLLIFILLVFIVLLYWKLRNGRYNEKEFSNEIREDALPPDRRSVSLRSGRTSRGPPSVPYSEVYAEDAIPFNEGSACFPSSSSHGHTPVKHTALEYNSKYGYAV